MPAVLQVGMLRSGADGHGGLDRVYDHLSRNLPSTDFHVISAVVGPADPKALAEGRVQASSSNSRVKRYLGGRQLINNLLQSSQIDLLTVHFAILAALVLDKLKKQPFVMHFHGPWGMEARVEGAGVAELACKHAVEKLVYRRADRVIVLSEAFRDLIHREFGVPLEKVRIVPGHVDLDRFASTQTSAEARFQLGLPDGRPILLTLRRLCRRMGLDKLVEAVALVARAVPDVLLCIGGSGEMRDPLEQQVRDLDLSRNVRFLGYVPDTDIPALYRAVDLNILPTSSLEGFGLVAAEALAAGTPSLVTPVGGLPEVVASLSSDLVFEAADAASMADRIVAVLRGYITLPNHIACRAYAQGRFAGALSIERTAAVYREVIL